MYATFLRATFFEWAIKFNVCYITKFTGFKLPPTNDEAVVANSHPDVVFCSFYGLQKYSLSVTVLNMVNQTQR